MNFTPQAVWQRGGGATLLIRLHIDQSGSIIVFVQRKSNKLFCMRNILC